MKNVLILCIILCFSCAGKKETVIDATKKSEPKIVEPITTPAKPNPPQVPNPPIIDEGEDFIEVEEIVDDAPAVDTLNGVLIEKFNHKIWDALLKQYVSTDGSVDYSGFKSQKNTLYAYIKDITGNMPDETWSTADKLAYWINAYNALTVDLIIRNYPLKSIKDIENPWYLRLWKFGNKWLNLNDIEHKILRKMNEPRIHFAIVCASKSCPNLLNTTFTAHDLEDQLKLVTHSFLTDISKNEISENNLILSKIFKWFNKDFTENGSLIDFLNAHTEIKISENAKKRYKAYDWDLNE